jgi:hypothetical protein
MFESLLTGLAGYFAVGFLVEVCDWSVVLLRKAHTHKSLRERVLRSKQDPEITVTFSSKEWDYIVDIWKCSGYSGTTLRSNDVDLILRLLEGRKPPTFHLRVAAMMILLWPTYFLAGACVSVWGVAEALWFRMQEALQAVTNKAWSYLHK